MLESLTALYKVVCYVIQGVKEDKEGHLQVEFTLGLAVPRTKEKYEM